MTTAVTVRSAAEEDVSTLNGIYNAYIVDSHVSFDTEAWSDDDRLEWFRDRVAGGHTVLVADREGSVVGAAWSGPWSAKSGYRFSVETTIVLAPGTEGGGIGTALYTVLLESLRGKGFHRAYAIIALPNDASVALHKKLGFIEVGVFDESGIKEGRFISTIALELKL